MTISLDTSAYSFFRRGHPALLELVQTSAEIAMSAIVVGELLAGFMHGTSKRANEAAFGHFIASKRVRTLQVDATTSHRYAEISTYLRRQGNPLPINDVWIAAHAMQHGLQVVTLDRHFLKMPQVSTLLFEL